MVTALSQDQILAYGFQVVFQTNVIKFSTYFHNLNTVKGERGDSGPTSRLFLNLEWEGRIPKIFSMRNGLLCTLRITWLKQVPPVMFAVFERHVGACVWVYLPWDCFFLGAAH